MLIWSYEIGNANIVIPLLLVMVVNAPRILHKQLFYKFLHGVSK